MVPLTNWISSLPSKQFYVGSNPTGTAKSLEHAMTIMTLFIIIFLVLIEKQITLRVVAGLIRSSQKFEDFIRSLFSFVIALISVVVVFWFIYDDASRYVVLYALCCCITMFRLDLDDTEQRFDSLKRM